MANYEADIRNALDSRLNTLAGGNPIATTNGKYKPVKGTTWLRGTVLKLPTRSGTMATDEHRGIYQVDIFAPKGAGPAATDTLADAVSDHFKKGTELTANTTVVRCRIVSRVGARSEDAWYHTPIEVYFDSFTPNR